MSGGSAPRGRKTEEYFTEKPWSGDSDEHEDWEKVLALKGRQRGGGEGQKGVASVGAMLYQKYGELNRSASRRVASEFTN